MEANTVKIDLKDWRKYALGEGVRGYKTDEFYCQLANDLYEILRPASGMNIIPSEHMHLLCIRLSQYVEDVVSDLGIFKAFRELNKSLDGRPLPFYEIGDSVKGAKGPVTTDANDSNKDDNDDSDSEALAPSLDYSPDKLNVDDIRLLIWDFVMSFSREKEIASPYNPDYLRLATELKVLMDEAVKNAPANSVFFKKLYARKEYAGYSEIKDQLFWLYSGCYLTASYHLEKELSEMTKRVNEAESVVKNKQKFKQTDLQSRKSLVETLLFEKSTRLLALPFYLFYGQMLKTAGLNYNAALVESMDGCIFQEYRVTRILKDSMVLESVDLTHYEVPVTVDFTKQVARPDDLLFVMCSLVKFEGKWHMAACRYYTYKGFFSTGDEGWKEDTVVCKEMKDTEGRVCKNLLKLQKGNELGFYREPNILMVNLVLFDRKDRIETIKKSIPLVESSAEKRQLRYQVDELEKEATEAEKLKKRIISLSPLMPVVAMAHKDKCATVYKDYVSELQISSNPYASPSKKPKESVEYVILHHFDYDLAKAVLTDSSLVISKQNISPNMKRVRRFIVDNVEFVTRYCYQQCFTGKEVQPYLYPEGSILAF